jgi:teichuronic acid biosynthesis glycosyltransferase TuaG
MPVLEPLVSIVMPSYNSEKVITSSIESVISQQYENWELLVVDDYSQDGTKDIVRSYSENDFRISLIALLKNNGAPAIPRNIGVSKANGEWIAFLDDDDVWHPAKLSIQMKAIYETKVKFCSTKMLNFTDSNSIEFIKHEKISSYKITFMMQLLKMRTPTSSVIVHKKLLLDHPFIEDIRYKAREDFECWLHIHEKIDYSLKITQTLLYYRVASGQISGNKWEMILKNLMVLSEFRLANGKSLGVMKYFYWASQALFSIYFRLMKKSL